MCVCIYIYIYIYIYIKYVEHFSHTGRKLSYGMEVLNREK